MRNILIGAVLDSITLNPGDVARGMPTAPPRRGNGAAPAPILDVPAEVAAAIAQPAPVETPAAPPVAPAVKAPRLNRFNGIKGTDGHNPNGLFTAVQFKAVKATTKTYKNDNGILNRKLANIMLEIGNSGLYVKASLKAERPANNPAKKPTLAFSFFGSKSGSCMAMDGGPQADADLDGFRQTMKRLGAKWWSELDKADNVINDDDIEIDGIVLKDTDAPDTSEAAE